MKWKTTTSIHNQGSLWGSSSLTWRQPYHRSCLPACCEQPWRALHTQHPPTSTPIFPSSSQQAFFEPFGIAFHPKKWYWLLCCHLFPREDALCCHPPHCSPARRGSAPEGRGAASLAVVLVPKRANCQNQNNRSQNNPASKYFFIMQLCWQIKSFVK